MDESTTPITAADGHRPPPAGVCFDRAARWRSPQQLPPLRLTDRCAAALAELLPVLLCGEESAALAFGGGVAPAALAPAARAGLARIRREEIVHGLLLQRLRLALPVVELEPRLLARMRRFFIRLADRDPGRYFARIAGLDSAVCLLIGALRGRRALLGADPAVVATFARIHHDEAGHVDTARRIALGCVPARSAIDVATETRRRLVALLWERGAAFEQLGIDADALFARVGNVSRGIFG